jgi:hypothetical protein
MSKLSQGSIDGVFLIVLSISAYQDHYSHMLYSTYTFILSKSLLLSCPDHTHSGFLFVYQGNPEIQLAVPDALLPQLTSHTVGQEYSLPDKYRKKKTAKLLSFFLLYPCW